MLRVEASLLAARAGDDSDDAGNGNDNAQQVLAAEPLAEKEGRDDAVGDEGDDAQRRHY